MVWLNPEQDSNYLEEEDALRVLCVVAISNAPPKQLPSITRISDACDLRHRTLSRSALDELCMICTTMY